jgi:hypothetical protein
MIADTLENLFRADDLCRCDRRRHVETKHEGLLATIDEDTSVKVRRCDISKETYE